MLVSLPDRGHEAVENEAERKSVDELGGGPFVITGERIKTKAERQLPLSADISSVDITVTCPGAHDTLGLPEVRDGPSCPRRGATVSSAFRDPTAAASVSGFAPQPELLPYGPALPAPGPQSLSFTFCPLSA